MRACVRTSAWVGGWVSVFHDGESFDKTVRIVDSFWKCAEAMSMPIQQQQQQQPKDTHTHTQTPFEAKDATAAIWFITNSDFMAFQRFLCTFFIRSYSSLNCSFSLSLSPSLPYLAHLLFKMHGNRHSKWVNRCWCRRCCCCCCCHSQNEMTLTIVSYLRIAYRVYCAVMKPTYTIFVLRSLTRLLGLLASYLYSEYKFERINCISFLSEMRQRAIFAAAAPRNARTTEHIL